MREIFYREDNDKDNKPRRTICLLVDDKTKAVIAKGVAKRSLKDSFNRKRGVAIARGRAKKAVTTETTEYDGDARFFKRVFHPSLTLYEKTLLARAEGES